jgi:hypothetical protein
MYKSKMPLRMWFLVIHLMTSTKKPFSALELQRQLGYKFYEPIWDMMRKIRLSMGNRDAKYTLKGNIEVDEAYFEVVDLPEKDELGNVINVKLKRGLGSQRQCPVLVMVESKPIENTKNLSKHNKGRVMGFVKMIVMDDTVNNIGLNYQLRKSLDATSHIITDGHRGYSKATDVVQGHTPIVLKNPKDASKKLPWVHTVISNAKRQFLGTHHSIGKEYLQAYLNEFCWKLNRRNFEVDLFDRMLIAGSQDTWF